MALQTGTEPQNYWTVLTGVPFYLKCGILLVSLEELLYASNAVYSEDKNNPPWMNEEILSAIRERDILFHERNQVVNMVRRSKQTSYLNGADIKTFWKTVRPLNCNTTSIPTLTDSHNTAETSMTKATILNNFFTRFNKDQPLLSNSQTEFAYDTLRSSDCPIDLLCTEDSVQYMLMQLDTFKSTSIDGISPKMLKCMCLLSFIWYRSFAQQLI